MKHLTDIRIYLIILSTIVFIRPTESYILTLVKSFIYHFMIVYLIVGIFWIIRRKWALAITAVLASIILSAHIFPQTISDNPEPITQTKIKIAHFNILKFNKNYKKMIDSAIKTDADFISFQEVDNNWAENLVSALENDYPYYQIEAKDENCHGLAVFSKYKLENTEIVYLENVANILGEIEIQDSSITFMTTHTNSPITRTAFYARNRQIDSVARILEKKNNAMLAIGDYNAVPWDSAILQFKEKTGLIDSRKSLTATYPNVLGKLGIPIDYIFHSDKICCTQFNPIYNTSSDHAGIYGEYYIR